LEQKKILRSKTKHKNNKTHIFKENMTLSKLSETQKELFLSRCEKLKTTSCCMNRKHKSYTRINATKELTNTEKGNILIAAFISGMIAVFAGIAVARFIQTKIIRRRRAYSVVGSAF